MVAASSWSFAAPRPPLPTQSKATTRLPPANPRRAGFAARPCPRLPGSDRDPAAVDGDDGSVQVARLVRSEKDDRLRDLFRGRGAAERDGRHDGGEAVPQRFGAR